VSASNGEPAVNLQPGRSLTGFYVAVGIVIAVGLFGGWMWKTWTVWWFDADEARRRQAEAARQLGLPVETEVAFGGGAKLELVLVPAGRFRMGSPAKEKDRSEDEAQHWVVITRPFYIGKYEVTQEQWAKVMGTNPSSFKGPKNPVECVSWDECQEFLKKLNGLAKERGQFRLPTEAEWEWACHAGTRTRYCSGDADEALADYAWFYTNSGGTTHPVGTRKPNAWGLHDLHGNVEERCVDWYGEDYYAKSPRYDPTGPATGSIRVVRGGSWTAFRGHCRSSDRSGAYTVYHMEEGYTGFRVVVVPAGP
jgi:formylglycine-generating enzyme required for sulfatase activity